jgi:hypothetical protein
MRTRLAIVLLAASPLLASGEDESVASLTEIAGHVLLSTGSSIASATGPVRLVPGMRVLTTPASSAEVVFDDGCRVPVGPDERYVVEKESPCE